MTKLLFKPFCVLAALCLIFVLGGCSGREKTTPLSYDNVKNNSFVVNCETTENATHPVWTSTTDPGVVIAGTRWATRNVGRPGHFVACPAEPGMLFQFHRTVGHSNVDPRRSWLPDTAAGAIASVEWNRESRTGSTPWGTNNRGPCPVGWRLPTAVEFRELVNASPGPEAPLRSTMGALLAQNTDRGKWVAYRSGKVFGDPSGASVFLPAVGFRNANALLFDVGNAGYYWSSLQSGATGAWYLRFYNGRTHITSGIRTHAFAVRCVAE